MRRPGCWFNWLRGAGANTEVRATMRLCQAAALWPPRCRHSTRSRCLSSRPAALLRDCMYSSPPLNAHTVPLLRVCPGKYARTHRPCKQHAPRSRPCRRRKQRKAAEVAVRHGVRRWQTAGEVFRGRAGGYCAPLLCASLTCTPACGWMHMRVTCDVWWHQVVVEQSRRCLRKKALPFQWVS